MRWGLGLPKVVWKKKLIYRKLIRDLLGELFSSGQILNRRRLFGNLWFIDVDEGSRRKLKNIVQYANGYY